MMYLKFYFLINSLFALNNNRFRTSHNSNIETYKIPDEVWKKHFDHQKLKNSTITNSN